ncbi:MAG TPA: extracellular solute-binding protein [Candidatus Limiplasma sp.]|nr:extracellular solute-binding protein [Candidatus Limiplasma sp.]
MKLRATALLLCFVLAAAPNYTFAESVDDYAPADNGRLVIYTSHKVEIYQPIIREFEQRTGIWVQVVSGGTNDMLKQIALESDYPQADLMFGGGVESLNAYSDYFAELPADICGGLDTHAAVGKKWLPFSLLPIVLIYNRKLVTQPPESWADLLDSRWSGSIAYAKPDVSGSSYTALITLLLAVPGEDENILRAFYQNLEGKLLDSSGDVVGAVSDGDCAIGITLEETALKGIAAGKEIGIVYPADGTSNVPDGIAIVKGCAHWDNALTFIRFVLGEDVQRRLITTYYRHSVLSSLAGEDTQAQEMRLLDYDIQWASDQKSSILTQWNALAAGE